MKRAVFFLPPQMGGAERMTITIAKTLDRNEYDVRFVVIGKQMGEIKDFIPEGYPLSLIRIRNIYDFTTLRTYRLLRKIQPQYVCCSLHYLNPRVIIAARWINNCKSIVRFNCAVSRLHGINKYLTRITYPKATKIIAQTEAMQEDLEHSFPDIRGKIVTMHNLIDIDTIAERLKNADNPLKSETNKVFVWVGRLDPVKGVEVLIKAFIEANHQRQDISLYLVGRYNEQSPYYQNLIHLVNGSPWVERIHFVGFQDNPYKWMSNADCFVLSSNSEGSPNVLFEALYLGVPVAVTDCTPNINDIVKDGVNGYRAKVGDYKGLASAMLKALNLKNVQVLYQHSTKDDFKALFQ
jgi:glycosyltransferase involved in cell wall biosynthesis